MKDKYEHIKQVVTLEKEIWKVYKEIKQLSIKNQPLGEKIKQLKSFLSLEKYMLEPMWKTKESILSYLRIINIDNRISLIDEQVLSERNSFIPEDPLKTKVWNLVYDDLYFSMEWSDTFDVLGTNENNDLNQTYGKDYVFYLRMAKKLIQKYQQIMLGCNHYPGLVGCQFLTSSEFYACSPYDLEYVYKQGIDMIAKGFLYFWNDIYHKSKNHQNEILNITCLLCFINPSVEEYCLNNDFNKSQYNKQDLPYRSNATRRYLEISVIYEGYNELLELIEYMNICMQKSNGNTKDAEQSIEYYACKVFAYTIFSSFSKKTSQDLLKSLYMALKDQDIQPFIWHSLSNVVGNVDVDSYLSERFDVSFDLQKQKVMI